MNLLGFEITLRKKAAPVGASSVPSQSFSTFWPSMWGGIRESFAGAWQRDIIVDPETNILAFSAVYACVTGIAADIAKMRIKLSRDVAGVWEEITSESQGTSATWLNLVRRPNHFQTHQQFLEQWIISKLLYGNTYVLKERESIRGLVRALYVLHPQRVTPLVAEDGSVWYRIRRDDLSQVSEEETVVPASEIIHDRGPCLWHPLVGVPPIYACGRSATMGNKIQNNSTEMFKNLSMPTVAVMFPEEIGFEAAQKYKELWEANYGGANLGRTAILDQNAKIQVLSIPAEQAQLIEQLKWTVSDVGRAFRYPPWKMGGDNPTYATSPEAIAVVYYTDCLQQYVEAIELLMEEGIELPRGVHVELDLDSLLRMDTSALFDSINKGAAWMKVDEQRFRANLKPLKIGGDTVYKQHQDYSIEALAKRDAKSDPFETTPKPEPEPPEPEADDEEDPPAEEDVERGLDGELITLYASFTLKERPVIQSRVYNEHTIAVNPK